MAQINIRKVLTKDQCITLNGILQTEIQRQKRKKANKIKNGDLTLYENIRIEEVEKIVELLQTEQWKKENW